MLRIPSLAELKCTFALAPLIFSRHGCQVDKMTNAKIVEIINLLMATWSVLSGHNFWLDSARVGWVCHSTKSPGFPLNWTGMQYCCRTTHFITMLTCLKCIISSGYCHAKVSTHTHAKTLFFASYCAQDLLIPYGELMEYHEEMTKQMEEGGPIPENFSIFFTRSVHPLC